EAVEVARLESPLLREATASLRSSEAGATGALGGFLPNISFGYGYSEASTGRLDATGQGITARAYTSRLRGSLTLFDGFRTLNELRTARAEVSAEEATLEERRFDAVLSVKTAFFNAVAARERAAVEAARVERQEEQLAFTRALLDLGRGTRSDTLRARVDLNDARLALLTARNDARSAEFALAEAMGLEERVAPSPEARLEVDTLQWEREELMAIAVGRAPTVVSAERSVAAATAGVASARSSYWPSLSLNGGWDWRNEEFPPANRSWSVSFSGTVPIFNGLQRETGVDRAQSQVEAARARRQSAELAVRTQVQGAYDLIRTALAGLALAEESVEAAAEDLRVSQQRFRLGVATSLDLRSAQIALAQAQVDVIRRRFDHEVGIAQLERLLGMSLEQLEPGSAGAEEER
ncbi:MAG: TolC family protein, partial [Gemmatimonadetes bacterium]|nr:TolC family protein [Gemmatimonadota bacterium]NIR81350.1 TolC family protein [Gemmatimonadota bacterium]NIT90183.1 TolC family protein [Gemmatimonadota bacterium]NIU34010.1 TolC family protein [Gemmatimonadota bacterium]NIU38175.1 TolC family protein [Gemmatimonadota bacterium]